MKRTLTFNLIDDSYVCLENGKKVFTVSQSDLQFDVREFYEAFYGEGKDYSDIVLENAIPDNGKAKRVFDCITKLMNAVKMKLYEMQEQTNEVIDSL